MYWKHIHPLNDENDHDTSEESGRDCPCRPEIDWANQIVIHSAFDGRDLVEQAEEILNQQQPSENTKENL